MCQPGALFNLLWPLVSSLCNVWLIDTPEWTPFWTSQLKANPERLLLKNSKGMSEARSSKHGIIWLRSLIKLRDQCVAPWIPPALDSASQISAPPLLSDIQSRSHLLCKVLIRQDPWQILSPWHIFLNCSHWCLWTLRYCNCIWLLEFKDQYSLNKNLGITYTHSYMCYPMHVIFKKPLWCPLVEWNTVFYTANLALKNTLSLFLPF